MRMTVVGYDRHARQPMQHGLRPLRMGTGMSVQDPMVRSAKTLARLAGSVCGLSAMPVELRIVPACWLFQRRKVRSYGQAMQRVADIVFALVQQVGVVLDRPGIWRQHASTGRRALRPGVCAGGETPRRRDGSSPLCPYSVCARWPAPRVSSSRRAQRHTSSATDHMMVTVTSSATMASDMPHPVAATTSTVTSTPVDVTIFVAGKGWYRPCLYRSDQQVLAHHANQGRDTRSLDLCVGQRFRKGDDEG